MNTETLEAEISVFDLDLVRLKELLSKYDAERYLANLAGINAMTPDKLETAKETAEFIKGLKVDMDSKQLKAIQESPSTHYSLVSKLDENLELMEREYAGLKRYDADLKSRMEELNKHVNRLLELPKGVKLMGIKEFNEWFADTSTVINTYRDLLQTTMDVVGAAIKKVSDAVLKGQEYRQRYEAFRYTHIRTVDELPELKLGPNTFTR